MLVSHRSPITFALAIIPLAWGTAVFALNWSVPKILPKPLEGIAPLEIWVWGAGLALLAPIWIWLRRLDLDRQLVTRVSFGRFALYLGTPRFYLILAYAAALSAVFTQETMYAETIVFGVIVSPVIEELFTRYLVTPWLRRGWWTFLGVAALSSASFSLMHWGYHGQSRFELELLHQASAFLDHFVFGMVLCVLLRLTKCLPLVIWLHAVSNLAWVLFYSA